MRSYNFNLLANVEQEIGVVGNHFRILEATNNVYVSVDNAPFLKVKAGQGLTDNINSFSTLKVRSFVNQSIMMVAGVGTFYDSNESVNVTTTTTVEAANTYKPNSDVLILAGTSAALVGANPIRKLLLIKNPVTNSVSFRLGVPLDVGAGKGDRLDVGETIALALTGALSAYNEGLVDESLIVSELESI